MQKLLQPLRSHSTLKKALNPPRKTLQSPEPANKPPKILQPFQILDKKK